MGKDKKNFENSHIPPHLPLPLHMQDEKFRARFELDSAYRDLRRGELIMQQIEISLPQAERVRLGRRLLVLASDIYQSAYKKYQHRFYYDASEYAAAVKDLMRGMDKLYNTTEPFPVQKRIENSDQLGGEGK